MTTDNDVRFPNVTVDLIGQDGNAFSILGRVQGALHKGGATPTDKAEYYAEATSGDYDHLLRTTLRWVNVTESDQYEDDDSDWDDDDDYDEGDWDDATWD